MRSARKLKLDPKPIVQMWGAKSSGVASTGEVVCAEEEGSAVSTLNPREKRTPLPGEGSAASTLNALVEKRGPLPKEGSAVSTLDPPGRLTDEQLEALIIRMVRHKSIPCKAVAAEIARNSLAPTVKQCRKACWAVHQHYWESIYTGPDARARCAADGDMIVSICRDNRRKMSRSTSCMLEDDTPMDDLSSISSSSELSEHDDISPSSSCTTDLELAELELQAKKEGLAAGAWRAVATQPAQKAKAKAAKGKAKGKPKAKATAAKAKSKGRTRKPEALAPGCQPKKGKGAAKARAQGQETGKMSAWQQFYSDHKNDPDVLALETMPERNARIGDKYWAAGKPCTKCRNAQNCCTAGRARRARALANLGLQPAAGA